MMYKKILLIAVLLSVLMSGCSSSHAPKIGLCFRACGEVPAFSQSLQKTMEAAGYEVIIADAKADQNLQIAQIEELIREKYDLLVVEPVITEEAIDLVDRLKSADIPVILTGYEPGEEIFSFYDRVSYVGFEPAQPGILQKELIASLPAGGDLNGDGITSCIVISGPDNDMDAQLRAAPFALPENNIETLSIVHGDWNRESGEFLCSRELSRFGKDIEVVICSSDDLTAGALEAILAGGRTVGRDIYLLGIGGQKSTMALIDAGGLSGTVHLDTQAHAKATLEAASGLLTGEPVPKRSIVSYVPYHKY